MAGWLYTVAWVRPTKVSPEHLNSEYLILKKPKPKDVRGGPNWDHPELA